MSLWEYLSWPFAKLMAWLYEMTGNYGLSLIVFSLIINLVLAPFMAKSKKSTMRTSRLQPRIQELQKRHAGNQQQLNAEMQKLYQEEGINPASGCLWSLLPMFLLLPIYRIVIMPISRMMYASAPRAGEAVVEAMKDYFTAQGVELASQGRSAFYVQIELTNLFHQSKDAILSALREAVDAAGAPLNLDLSHLMDMDLSFLGVDLGATPTVSTLWSGPWTWAAIGLFLIPVLSALLSWLSMTVSTKMNPAPAGNEQSAGMMKGMNFVMPLMSLWFCFIMPAAMGVYWIANSVFGMIRDVLLTMVFKKKLDEEDALREANRSERERELEEKRLETERLRAEGKTEVNVNTSKKKLQASEKQKSDERKAALDRADRAARRERLGIREAEKPASQVGNRRYARGRAYVEDRFTNPEEAEEATAKAALASEDAPTIDESVEETGEV